MSGNMRERIVDVAPARGTTGGLQRAARVLGRPTVLHPDTVFVVALVIAAFALRVIAAIVLHGIVFARGYTFFTRGDDQAYDSAAWQQAQAWRGAGPAVDVGHTYLLNAYTYTEAGLYLLVGHRPFAMILLNCACGALAAGVVYLLALHLFDRFAARFSAIVAAFFPSMFFWSLLNLKDAMALLSIAILLWLVTRLVTTGDRRLILPVLATLAVVGSLRIYIGGLLSVLIPVAVALQHRARFPRKWPAAATLLAGSVVILWLSGGGAWFVQTFPLLGQMRFANAGEANSAYVPAAGSIAGSAVTTAVASTGTAPATAVPTIAAAGGAAVAPAPTADPDAIARRGSLRELVHWFPIGLAYALGAPFPWAARRAVELATAPEMLLWYAALVLAAIGFGVHWRRWRHYVPIAGYLVGALFVMAVAEGTIGTLLRHRTMIILPTLIFSGAGVAWLWSRWRSRGARYGPRSRPTAALSPPSGD